MITPLGEDFDSTNVNAAGMVPCIEQAFSRAERDGKYFEPEFIHQVMRQQRLEEIGAPMHLQFRTIPCFELFDLLHHVPAEKDRLAPTCAI